MIFRRGKDNARRTRRCCADRGLDGLIRFPVLKVGVVRDIALSGMNEVVLDVDEEVEGVDEEVNASNVKALFWSNSIKRTGDL